MFTVAESLCRWIRNKKTQDTDIANIIAYYHLLYTDPHLLDSIMKYGGTTADRVKLAFKNYEN